MKSSLKRVSIFGCGWLGTALANILESEYIVKVAVKTSSSYSSLSFANKFLLNEQNRYFSKDFFETDVLVISIPPSTKYIDILQKILKYVSNHVQVVLCSSISVYAQNIGIIIEEGNTKILFNNNSAVLEGELKVLEMIPKANILRLGGLMGYSRVAGKYTAGKNIQCDGYTNYIHRDDVVEIMKLFIENRYLGRTYNLVSPQSCLKSELYDKNASKYGFEKSNFLSYEVQGKRVSSKKLIKETGYDFLYANPIDFWN